MPLLPSSTLFPYTTLFRSYPVKDYKDMISELNQLILLEAEGKSRKDILEEIALKANLGLAYNPEIEVRSEEHTSELQSRGHLVCRLPLEKKKQNTILDMSM